MFRQIGQTFSALIFFGSVLCVQAEEKELKRVTLPTADGVELHGRYLPGEQKSPAVIILDDLAGNARPKICDALARALGTEGCAVLCIEFRGHGKSVEVGPDFWNDLNNRKLVRGFNASNPRDTISADDFQRGYAPYLANDVAAARMFLDQRNDVGDCNTRQIIVVGFGSGATIGSLWVASEWTRYRSYGGNPDRLAIRPEGRDVAGCIWVDMRLQLDRQPMPVWDWLQAAETKHGTLIGWIYRDSDQDLARFAERCESLNQPDKKVFVKSPVTAPARELLAENAKVIPEIKSYVKSIRDKKDSPLWAFKNYFGSRFIWVSPGALNTLAKERGEELLQPLQIDKHLKTR